MKTRSLRLSSTLAAEADAYAASLGISFNALIAVALRDYLDMRSPASPAPPTAPAIRDEVRLPAPTPEQKEPALPAALAHKSPFAKGRKVRPHDLCPCGSRYKFKNCCGA